MASTYTPNINLEQPARGDDVGTWDMPVNNNSAISDLVAGGTASIPLNNSPVILAAAQFQCANITFNSTLTGSVTITFPTSFKKPYSVYHACTGSSAFTITLATTAAGGEAIAIPPGVYTSVLNDGANLRFTGLERVGTYWDYAGSSTPNWNDICTKPPYIPANGGAFSAVTYPILAGILGGTIAPDQRGRVRMARDAGAGRVSSANFGSNPDTVGNGGGNQTIVLGSSQLPASIPIKDDGHIHTTIYSAGISTGPGTILYAGSVNATNVTLLTCAAVTGITVNPSTGTTGTGGTIPTFQPTMVGGITMIRAG